MRSAIAGCAAGLAALAVATAAPAATMTFDGSCHVTGVATFKDPLSGPPKADEYDFVSGAPSASSPDATTCSGTLGDKQLANAPATVHVHGAGNLSCAFSSAQGAAGTLTLTNGTADPSDDLTMAFTLDIVGALTEVGLQVHGQQSGSGAGHASFLQYADPATTPSECSGQSGDGVKALGFAADFQTAPGGMTGDVTSGAPAGSGTQSGGGQTQYQSSSGSGAPGQPQSAPSPSSSSAPASSSQPSSASPSRGTPNRPTHARHKKKHRKHRKHRHKKHQRKKKR